MGARKIEYPIPDIVIDKLNPMILKVVRELGVQGLDFGEDWTEFIYEGQRIRIEVKAK